MLNERYTHSTVFILPIIFDKYFSKQDLENNEFVNMFLYNTELSFVNHFFIVFHKISHTFLSKLRNIDTYVKDYKFINGINKYTCIVFSRNTRDNLIINTCKNGCFNCLKQENKEKILNFWKPKGNSKVYQYLFGNYFFIKHNQADEVLN